jgi:hypothetical protein
MRQLFRAKWMFAVVALCTALGAGALLAQDKTPPAAAGGGVTFQNASNHAIEVYARFGADGTCDHQPNQVEIQVAAGASGTVDSGSSKVCFCLDVPARNNCPTGWGEVKAGGKRVLR